MSAPSWSSSNCLRSVPTTGKVHRSPTGARCRRIPRSTRRQLSAQRCPVTNGTSSRPLAGQVLAAQRSRHSAGITEGGPLICSGAHSMCSHALGDAQGPALVDDCDSRLPVSELGLERARAYGLLAVELNDAHAGGPRGRVAMPSIYPCRGGTSMAQAKHTARVLLSECRARRHGHGFWFAFNAAQRARMRASAPAPMPAPPDQPDLFE